MKRPTISSAMKAAVDAAISAADAPRAAGFSELEGPITELVLAATAAGRAVENLNFNREGDRLIVVAEEHRVADFLVNEVLRRAQELEVMWHSRQAEACAIESEALAAECDAGFARAGNGPRS